MGCTWLSRHGRGAYSRPPVVLSWRGRRYPSLLNYVLCRCACQQIEACYYKEVVEGKGLTAVDIPQNQRRPSGLRVTRGGDVPQARKNRRGCVHNTL